MTVLLLQHHDSKLSSKKPVGNLDIRLKKYILWIVLSKLGIMGRD